MSEWKDRLNLPDAPDAFEEAIRAGGNDIRRYEIRRGRLLRRGLMAVAALVVAAIALVEARGWLTPRDSVFTAPGAATQTPSPSPEAPLPTALPMTNGGFATRSPLDATPMPAPTAHPELLYGKGMYGLGAKLAERVLPELPPVRHVAYVKTGPALSRDELVRLMIGDDWTFDEANGRYEVEAGKNPHGAAMNLIVQDAGVQDRNVFSISRPGGAEETAPFASESEAYDAMYAWLASWLPVSPYLDPAHLEDVSYTGVGVGESGHVGRPNECAACWLQEMESGVCAQGGGVQVVYTPSGPTRLYFEWNRFEPAADDPSDPSLLTAAQAIDAFNDAADLMKGDEVFIRNGWLDPDGGTVEDMNLTYSFVFGREAEYRLSWRLYYTDANAAHGNMGVAYVDAETGLVHFGPLTEDGVFVDTGYTQAHAAAKEQAGGALLYGGEGYRLAGECADGLPETPDIRHSAYVKTGGALDPDTVAGWLWGDAWTRQSFSGAVVYTREADKGVKGSYKAKASCFEGDDSFFYAPDDPARLSADAFQSREAALEWARAWFARWLPEEYLAHPAHPVAYVFEGEAVENLYSFWWPREAEPGVGIWGSGLRGDICSYGPNYFSFDLSDYAPLEDGDPVPRYLSAAQAVDALNAAAANAARQAAANGAMMEDSAFGTFEDTIELVRPMFAGGMFRSDEVCTFCWQITLRGHETGWPRLFFVDGETGAVWNDHEGLVQTVYSDGAAGQ